jgi:predicted kinase
MIEINNVLICTVGLPRSGKSTWAKTTSFPIVNKDAIRLALHGKRYLLEAEGMVNELSKIMVKSLFLAGHKTVILDETNITKQRRDVWLSNDWTTEYTVFDTPKEICIERALLTDDYEIIPIIEKMSDQWEDVDNGKM